MRLWHEGHFEHLSQFLTLNQRFHIYHSDAYAKQYTQGSKKMSSNLGLKYLILFAVHTF